MSDEMSKKSPRTRRKRAEKALTELAAALDKCDSLSIKLEHGILMSKYGYVIRFKRGWRVRMLRDPDLD